MTNRELVISWLVACLNSEEADGFQQHEGEEFVDKLNGWGHDDKNLWVDMGDDIFTIRITKDRKRSKGGGP